MRWHGQAGAGAVPRFTAPRHTATAEWRVVPVQRGACGIRAPGHTACKRAAEVHVPDPDVTPPTSGLQVLRGPGRWPPAMAVGAQGSGMAGVQCLPPPGPSQPRPPGLAAPQAGSQVSLPAEELAPSAEAKIRL